MPSISAIWSHMPKIPVSGSEEGTIGSRLNIKTIFPSMSISIIKRRWSCLYNGNVYTGKTAVFTGLTHSALETSHRAFKNNLYLGISWGSVIDDKSTWIQIMAWCLQAPSHYLNPCWLRSLMHYNVSRGQWVNLQPNIYYLAVTLFWI